MYFDPGKAQRMTDHIFIGGGPTCADPQVMLPAKGTRHGLIAGAARHRIARRILGGVFNGH